MKGSHKMVSLSTLLNNLIELINQYVYTKTETKDNFDNYIEDYLYYVNGVFSSTKNLIYFNDGSDTDLYNPQNAIITTSNNILTITTSSSGENKVSFPTIWFDKDANCYMEMTYQGGTSQPIAICFNRQSNTTWGSVSYDPSNNRFSNSLSGINALDNVVTIGGYAFSGCSSLTAITIGDRITSIGEGAFDNCSSFTSITVNATTPPTLAGSVFTSTNDCPIYVPAASVETYKRANRWSDYASRIQAIP